MRGYEKEFKEEAVKLSKEIGTNEVAKWLGVPKDTLSSWRRLKKDHREQAFLGSGKRRIDPETAKETELLKKIKELERANDILKESLFFFAKRPKK